MLQIWIAAKAQREALESEARDCLARHGQQAYGAVRERIRQAALVGNRAEITRLLRLRAAIRKIARGGSRPIFGAPHLRV